MISVALCTYNGERYIEEQLLSIIHQTEKVDEIVVCDDCSVDNTIKRVEQIAVEHPEIKFNINVNEQNFGVTKNFEKAILLCQGDIVFLSDQDDEWYPNKVASIVRWFENNSQKSVVFSNAELINEQGSRYDGKTTFDYFGFTKKQLYYIDKGFALELLCCMPRITGATMAIKRESIRPFAKYATPHIIHDTLLAIEALSNNYLGYISESLMKYRIHHNQEVGIRVFQKLKEKTLFDMHPFSRIICEEFLNIPFFSIEQKLRIEFLKERIDIQNSISGFVLCKYIPKYVCFYGIFAVIFIIKDYEKIFQYRQNKIIDSLKYRCRKLFNRISTTHNID